MEKPKIDMWTADYKSTPLKLNCAKSIAAQIPSWMPLILIINLLARSLTQRGSYPCHDSSQVMKKHSERGRERDNGVMGFALCQWCGDARTGKRCDVFLWELVAGTAFINVNLADPETSSLNVPVIHVNICRMNCASWMRRFSKTTEALTGPWRGVDVIIWLLLDQSEATLNPNHKYQLVFMISHLAGCAKKPQRKRVTRNWILISFYPNVGGTTVKQRGSMMQTQLAWVLVLKTTAFPTIAWHSKHLVCWIRNLKDYALKMHM